MFTAAAATTALSPFQINNLNIMDAGVSILSDLETET